MHTNVVCCLCGCLCDDLVIETAEDRIVRVERACPEGAVQLQKISQARAPTATCDGRPSSHATAIDKAVRLLRESRAPLIFGLQTSTTEDQRQAIELAEHLGAVMETSGSHFTRSFLLAFQQAGLSTCTLGEVRQRADLILFWGADPVRTHPRLIERLLQADSEFLPRGRADRTLIAVNDRETSSTEFADVTIPLAPGRHPDALAAIRRWIQNPAWQPMPAIDLPLSSLQSLARKMAACRYGMLFFGEELAAGPSSPYTMESLIRLVTDLNAFTRFSARPLSQPGAEQVLTWQTGYPVAVDFQQGFPRYQPGEFSADDLLARGDVDCCLLVGSPSLVNLSPAAMQRLHTIPTIVLDPPATNCPFVPQVRLTTAFPGVQSAGTAYRMDGIALPLRSLCASASPATAIVLREIMDRIKAASETPV